MIAYIGVGGNLGSEDELLTRFRAAASGLAALGPTRVSAIYRTAPHGPVADQPAFLNAALRVEVQSAVTPLSLLGHLQSIETRLGRVRPSEIRFGPRVIDLDLLLMGDVSRSDPKLTLPHPRMHERGFVLLPLSDVAPADLWIAGADAPLSQALERVSTDGCERLTVTLAAA